MPVSMSSRQWCPACDVDYYTHHRWLHLQSKRHQRRVNERFPLPPSPWRTEKPQNKISPAPKFPHLTYRKKASKP